MLDEKPKTKVLLLITKSNWGENENSFSFSPVLSGVKEQSLLSETKQTVGEKAWGAFARLALLICEATKQMGERVDSVCKTAPTQLLSSII